MGVSRPYDAEELLEVSAWLDLSGASISVRRL
jgi:hypothetical protein